jgi:hypothetical protein
VAASDSKRLERALKKASGRKKGLLVANAKARLEVYNKDLVTTSEMDEMLRGPWSNEEARVYNKMLDAQDVVQTHIANAQVRYLQLREQLAHLGGLFMLFRQQVSFEEFLNELSWGRAKSMRALRERIGSSGRAGLFGTFGLREDDGCSWVGISVSEDGTELALEWAKTASEQAKALKTTIEVVRAFMEVNDVHLAAYEDLLNGWEKELRGLIVATKEHLLPVGSDHWAQMRELYAQRGEERLNLVEALLDYDSIELDEDAVDEQIKGLEDNWNDVS